jgi:histidinol dehydrogenase/phosphoribosyl-ATP pyrophosphohydrolase
MIIPSIDLMDGRAVQLVGGREKALDAGDPRPIAEQMAVAGEIAVIDLDAALGQGSNESVIRDLLRIAPCRVGGGIRDADTARRWLDAGARRVILGTAARPDVLAGLPRDRVVAALDAEHGEVVVRGWRERTGRGVIERMAELRDLVGGFLVTIIEREGRLEGIDLDAVAPLVEAAGTAALTVAGGIATVEELAALDELGVDGQVGMALYTGRMSLADAIAAPLHSDRADGLWPTVVTDERGVALGLAWSSAESLRAAVEQRRGVYQSRSRGLWVKGKSSGARQELLRVDLDCDNDALRFTVRQHGPGFCHRETRTCWGPDGGIGHLARRLAARAVDAPAGSYTARLLDDPALLRAKLLEEAGELADATTAEEATWEAADLMYFALVAMARRGVPLEAVERELDRRSGVLTRRAGDAKPAGGSVTARPPEGETTDADAPFVGLRRRRLDDLPAQRRSALDAETVAAARRIVEDVKTRGEVALLEHARRLDGLGDGAPLLHDARDLRRSLDALPVEQRRLLERTAERIDAFARAQRGCLADLRLDVPGGVATHRVAPVATAGCYAPGGRFPLPSSVLMTAVTARAAGVAEVCVASPRPAQATLAAAAIAGADALLAAGGAQAIAALTYGIGGAPACDVVVGPGNRWVTAAKWLVSDVVGIDMLAGPSELLLVADDDADPELVAADLLAQAEHDVDAAPLLVAWSAGLAEAVDRAVVAQLAALPTAATARAALTNGAAVIVADDDEAVRACDRIAPEHLQLCGARAEALAPRLSHYGGLFVGSSAAEVLGASSLAADAAALGRLEGLEAHARAAERRSLAAGSPSG